MPPSAIDFSVRADLIERMDEPCSHDVLRAYLRSLARTNRLTFGYRPTLRWLDSLLPALRQRGGPTRILDVGCGYGDGLRRIEQWAHSRQIAVELTGIDLNADAVAIAMEASPSDSRIEWIQADVFSFSPAQPPDLVMSSLFTHHLAGEEIVRFLRWMEERARIAWFVSDLSRAPIPYHFFRIYSRLLGLHPNVQYDGPISIARSFVAQDWQRMCAQAGLGNGAVEIAARKPARLCVSRRQPK
jgi:SAM-dependent methyltransferase